MTTVAQVGGRLGELRFDTDLDVSHAVVRYLELIKLSALLERTRTGELSVEEALPEVNLRLLQASTSEQREIFETSALDEYLLDAERDERLRARAVAARNEPSLEPFLPKRGDGLLLSRDRHRDLPDVPAEVQVRARLPDPERADHQPALRHPRPPGARALPRRRRGRRRDCPRCSGCWRPAGAAAGSATPRRSASSAPRRRQSLVRYHDRFREEEGEPVWFERAFQFRMGPHLLRGRVDRVDRLPDGGYELIDYKTGRPKTAAQLREDVQLSLYAVGARESWELDAAQQAYYYVLDDEKVPVERCEEDRDWITETVFTVAEGIQSQGFEPTPCWSACSMCDYRIACPAAERVESVERWLLPSPRWRRKRWNSRASTSPDGSEPGSGRPDSSSAARSSRSTKACTSGSSSTARETCDSYSLAASSRSVASTVTPTRDSSRRSSASAPFGFGATAT